ALDTRLVVPSTLSSCRCFFFSSRRRHTRFKCDWSSDVCSSDLCTSRRSASSSPSCAPTRPPISASSRKARSSRTTTATEIRHHRSEERRVGKECRRRWRPDEYNNKSNKVKRKRLDTGHNGDEAW